MGINFLAKKRSIEFLLTFEEWLKIWVDSGHYFERGCRKGQYVMVRKGDNGPYAVGNVRITTVEENRAEQKHSVKQLEQLVARTKGNKYGRKNKGKIRSVEAKHKMRLGHLGKKASAKTKAKMSEAQKRRRERERKQEE